MAKPYGFTLIELLIVIVLIGIMGGMTMLTIGNGNRRDEQRQEAERLLQLMQLAEQEAAIRAMPVALEFQRHGYRFLTLQQGRWQSESDTDVFRPRALPAPLALELTLDDRAWPLPDAASLTPTAHLVFTPDGDLPRVHINVTADGSDEIHAIAYTPKDGWLRVAR